MKINDENYFLYIKAHLDNNTWRLWEVPQRKAKKTHEGRLGLVCLRAASAEDAATCRFMGEINLTPICHQGDELHGALLSSNMGSLNTSPDFRANILVNAKLMLM